MQNRTNSFRRKILMIFTIILLFSFTISYFGVSESRAQSSVRPSVETESTITCDPYDLLFLIDQSSSMNGSSGNDPENQRIEAVRWVIRNVGFQSLFVCGNSPKNRIGVIPFGGVLDEKKLPLTMINPEKAADWGGQSDTLVNSIEPSRLGETDFRLAFDEAYRMFRILPTTEQNRKRAIIVITDGAACSREMSEEKSCGSPTAVKKYMAELDEDLQERFATDQYYLFVIGINRYDELPPEVQAFYNEVAIQPWEGITSKYITGSGYTQLGYGVNQIPVTFTDILDKLSGNTSRSVKCEPLSVDPYQESAQLNFFRNTTNSPVQVFIRDYDGKESVLINGKVENGGKLDVDYTYYSDGVNESYFIHHPVPGLWTITMVDPTYCEELRAQFIPIQASAVRVAPTGGLPQNVDKDITGLDYDPEDPYYLEYNIVDRFGSVLPAYGNYYPINADIIITSPSGLSYQRNLEYETTKGVWQSNEPLPTIELGTYHYSLVGKALSTDGKSELIIIPQQDGAYEVSQAVSRFSWQITSPASGKSSQISTGFGCATSPNDVEINLVLTDYPGPNTKPEDRTPIEPTGILSGETLFVIQVVEPAGNPLKIPFKYVGTSADPGKFRAIIPGDKLSDPGRYTLKVVMTEEINQGWGVRGIETNVNDVITLIRFDSPFTSRNACTASKVGSVVLAIILLILFIICITGKPHGYIYFVGPNGDDISMMSVARFWRWTVFKGPILGPIRAYIPIVKVVVTRDGGAKEHNSHEEGVPAIKITVLGEFSGDYVTASQDYAQPLDGMKGSTDGSTNSAPRKRSLFTKKENYLENDVIHDKGSASLIKGYRIEYYRWGK